MALENNDELLVNRSGTTYTLEQQNLMAEIQGDDLLLVNRSGTTYTATGQELIDSVIPDLELTISFVPNVAYIDIPVTAIGNTSGGVEPEGGFTFSYVWHLSDNINGENQANIIGANTAEYTPLEEQLGKFLGCTIQTTDDRGTIASVTSRLGPIAFKPPEAPPSIRSIVLSQDQVNSKRFASNSFTATVDATEQPNALALEAQVVGALSLDVSTDYITAEDPTGETPLELTLGSELNLGDGRFVVGDEVTTNTSYTPTTSGITSTEGGLVYDKELIANPGTAGWTFINSEDAFDGDLNTYGMFQCGGNGAGGPSSYRLMFDYLPGGGLYYTDRVQVWLQTYYSSALSDPFFEWGAATEIGSNGGSKTKLDNSTAPNGWYDIAVANGTPGVVTSFDISCWALGTPPNQGPKLKAIRVDGKILVNNQSELTCADGTDLNKLVAGDKVQSKWNTSEVWSSGLSWSGGQVTNARNAFDADLTTTATGGTSGTLTWTPASPITGRLEISVPADGSGTSTITLSDSTNQTVTSDSFCDFGAVTNITSVTITRTNNSSMGIKAVRLNGKLLVDAFDNSEVWSNSLVGASNPQYAFDGVLGTAAAGTTAASMGAGVGLEAVLSVDYTVNSTIAVHIRGFLDEQADLYVGDTLVGRLDSSTDDFEWVTLNYSGQISAANPLRIVNVKADKSVLFNGIKIDGTLLVDTGVDVDGFEIVSIDHAENKIVVDGGEWAVDPGETFEVDFAIVAGGGGGGTRNPGDNKSRAGGGGAGGYLSSFADEPSGGNSTTIVSPIVRPGADEYVVTIGAGGAIANNGTNSVFSGVDKDGNPFNFTAIGGGQGGSGFSSSSVNGAVGGSSGGGGVFAGPAIWSTGVASANGAVIAGTAGQGSDGGGIQGTPRPRAADLCDEYKSEYWCWDADNPQNYGGGGGGGALSAPVSGSTNAKSDGGAGITTLITGSSLTVAGGGAGEKNDLSLANGGTGQSSYGGGGNAGEAGNDGAVILRYPKAVDLVTIDAGFVINTVTVGSNNISIITAGSGRLLFEKNSVATQVSTMSPKQGKGTISSIDDNVLTIDPVVDNCFVNGQYLIHVNPKPIKITPKTEVITNTFPAGGGSTLSTSVEFLVIGGGAPRFESGVANTGYGGGGAGGYISSVIGEQSGGGEPALFPLTFKDGQEVAISVGAAGSSTTFGDYTALPGGVGSGNGGNYPDGSGNPGTAGQGFSGGDGSDWTASGGSQVCTDDPGEFACNVYCASVSFGGGGGAGAAGNAKNGGDGVQSSITGTATYYAGGGNAISWCTSDVSKAGVPGQGQENYGGGGGWNTDAKGGVVILRYDSTFSIETTGGNLTINSTVVGPKTVSVISSGIGTLKFAGIGSAGAELTFAGNDELIEFANGDPVSMCDANGSPVTAIVETSTISEVEVNGSTKLTFENTDNLAYFKAGDKLVDGPSTGFKAVTYAGNGGSQSITGLGFSPDLVWFKSRNSNKDHRLVDTVRGSGIELYSNSSTKDTAQPQGIRAFNSDGFEVGNDQGYNQSGIDYAAWCWDAGNTTVANSEGTVTCQVRANPATGFSVITANMPSTSNLGCTVGHGLNTAPAMYIVKDRDLSISWGVYHQGLSSPATEALQLNSTNAAFAAAGYWNSTSPTSSVLSVGTSIVTEGSKFVVYAFAPVEGASAFGSYESSELGAGINVGFKPAFVMIKRTTSGDFSEFGGWGMYTPDETTGQLMANCPGAELLRGDCSTNLVNIQATLEFTDTGFKIRSGSAWGETNQPGDNTYIYAAFASQEIFGTVLEDADTVAGTLTVQGGTWDGSNQSEVWSNYLSFLGAQQGVITNAFDGNLSTSVNSTTSGDPRSNAIVFTPDGGLPYTEGVKVYCPTGDLSARLNGGPWVDFTTEGVLATGSGVILTIEVTEQRTSASFGVSAYEVDGRLLVDAVEDSQVWSKAGVITNPTSDPIGSDHPSYSITNLYDGNLETQWGTVGGAGYKKSQMGISIPFENTFQVLINSNVDSGIATFYGANGTTATADLSDGSWVNGTSDVLFTLSGIDSPITGFDFPADGTGGGMYLVAFYTDGKMVVDPGVRGLGETTAKVAKSGTGVVDSVNLETNTMTLFDTNGEWVDGYYVSTPEKNAVEMRGYLMFDADGNNVDLSHFPQPAVLMNDVKDPTITFPSTFSTGEGVDTDLPYPTYMEVYAVSSNDLGSSARTKSNELFPQTTAGRSIPAVGSYRVMQEEFGEFCYWACSSDYRAAIKTVQNAESTVQQLRTIAERMAERFLERETDNNY